MIIIGVGKNLPQKEETMIFKPMALAEAKEFYEKLKAEAPSTIVKIAMDDIWFFTDGLQNDYGRGGI
jgi:hypothetical protein